MKHLRYLMEESAYPSSLHSYNLSAFRSTDAPRLLFVLNTDCSTEAPHLPHFSSYIPQQYMLPARLHLSNLTQLLAQRAQRWLKDGSARV